MDALGGCWLRRPSDSKDTLNILDVGVNSPQTQRKGAVTWETAPFPLDNRAQYLVGFVVSQQDRRDASFSMADAGRMEP